MNRRATWASAAERVSAAFAAGRLLSLSSAFNVCGRRDKFSFITPVVDS
jgi:hypothetical protein